MQDTDDFGMLHLFVKILLQAGMERSFRERELASKLLVALVPDPISHEQVAFGLSRTLASLDDYVLDVPDAAHLMTLFLARAIVDELVAPAFLTRVLDALHADSLAIVVVRNTGRLLASTHAAEIVLKVRPCHPPALSFSHPPLMFPATTSHDASMFCTASVHLQTVTRHPPRRAPMASPLALTAVHSMHGLAGSHLNLRAGPGARVTVS